MAKQQQIPFDMMIEILYRLPAKSLLRFRGISKPYCSVIDSPAFAKEHHSRSLKNNTNTTLHILDWNAGNEITCFDYDSLDKPPLSRLEIFFKENNQVKKNPYLQEVIWRIGYCNGLICFWCKKSEGTLFIINPTTCKNRVLPHLGANIQGELKDFIFVHGLGYDATNDDYKVVKISQYTDTFAQQCRSEVMVYSLKENAWKEVKVNFPYSLCCLHNETPFVCGNIIVQVAPMSALVPPTQMHTVPGTILVGFDLSKENFNVVPLPDSLIAIPNTIHLHAGRLGGCLCVTPLYSTGVRGDIWVIKEYGKKESWTKLISFSQETLRKYLATLPVAYSRKGDKVLLELTVDETKRRELFWYDLKENKLSVVKELKGKLPTVFLSDVMTDNLISLDVVERNEEDRDGQED